MGDALPVTVVIPAYRRPDMVERAIRSVQRQRQRPADIIVVDDASGDGTGERAAALGARVLTHESNRGEGAARNTGIEAVEHDWIALLDCDDEWLPGHLGAVWGARHGHSIVGAAVLGTGPDPAHHRVYGWTGRRPRVLRSPADVAVPENKLTPSAVLLSRSAALSAGGFRDLPRAADLDLWIRMLEQGTGVALPVVTVLYHLHSGQVSDDKALMQAAHAEVLAAYRDRPWCTPSLLRRHEGVLAWDKRGTQSEDGSAIANALGLARQLIHPQRAAGVAALLIGRFRGRRTAARISPGGLRHHGDPIS